MNIAKDLNEQAAIINRTDALLLIIDIQERLMPVIYENEAITKNTVKLIEGCTALNVPILLTEQYTKGLGFTTNPIKNALTSYEPFEKTAFSCWDQEGFPALLGDTHKKDILIAGVETHVCVQKTVLDLLNYGYHLYVIADCVSSRHENDQKISFKRMRQAGAVISTMESVLFEMCVDSKDPAFKKISAIVK